MLIRDITYKDLNGVTSTEKFYFHLAPDEVFNISADQTSLQEIIERIITTKDVKDMNVVMSEFRKVILAAYGLKSEDGKSFIKSDELRNQFSQTLAFQAIFMELLMNADEAAEFIKGILPDAMQKEIEKAEATGKSITLVPPPVPPVPPQPA